MPRPLRIEYPHAWYHVMNRGAGYRDIFTTKKHRLMFLGVLSEAVRLFSIEIHGYCLMNNHYHLLIKTPLANLGRAMRHINGVYTLRYNKDQKTDGPLFRGRYKAILVEDDAYMLQVSRYIHLNPIEAKMTKSLEDFHWSSYLAYIGKNKNDSWLTTDAILLMLHAARPHTAYRKFVQAGVDQATKEFYAKKKTEAILGEYKFKERMSTALHEKQIQASLPDYKTIVTLPSMEDIEKTILIYYKADKTLLYKKTRGKENVVKDIVLYGCRTWAKALSSDVAVRYGCSSRSSISNAINRINKKIKKEIRFENEMKKIYAMVTSTYVK